MPRSLFSFLIVLAGLMALSGCARFYEAEGAQEATEVDDYRETTAPSDPDKPFGTIFGEGYVTRND